MTKEATPKHPSKTEQRNKKRADNMRANLMRRKQQQRDRQANSKEP